jgi:positive regulator of sigma E activity
MNGACKTGRSALQAYNRKGLEISEGDTVEIEVPGMEQARGAFWVLGLPLVALFLGYGAGVLLFPGRGEGPAVAAAGIFFGLALFGGMLVQKGRKLDSLPVVLRKVNA